MSHFVSFEANAVYEVMMELHLHLSKTSLSAQNILMVDSFSLSKASLDSLITHDALNFSNCKHLSFVFVFVALHLIAVIVLAVVFERDALHCYYCTAPNYYCHYYFYYYLYLLSLTKLRMILSRCICRCMMLMSQLCSMI